MVSSEAHIRWKPVFRLVEKAVKYKERTKFHKTLVYCADNITTRNP